MKSSWQIENLIREAIEAGEFDNLPGAGKPLEIDTNQDVMQSKLRDLGFVPKEVHLRKQLALLENTPANFKLRQELMIEIDILTQTRLGKI